VLIIVLIGWIISRFHLTPIPVCQALDTSAPTPGASAATSGRAAFLIDVSGSTRTADGDVGAPDYAADLAPYLDTVVDDQDAISVASFSGPASLAWSAYAVLSDWKQDNANPGDQRLAEGQEESCLQPKVTAAADVGATQPGTDVLGALRAAAQWLDQGKGPKQLFVATDGLDTGGCAGLTGSSFDDPAEIQAIAQVCVGAGGEIKPGELAGVGVTFVGLGQPGPDHPVPTTAQSAWLTGLWQKLASTAGASSCVIEPSTAVVTSPLRQKSPATGATDPPVGFGDGRAEQYSVPAASLFPVDQAVMLGSGRQELNDIAVQIRVSADPQVTVYGYVDPTGTAARNSALAQERADAVATVLEQYGVADVEAYGRGVPDSCPYALPSPATTQELYQCDRRVDIAVQFTEGP
jgi:outer membrane protein OmpA-like peptidoglycan-associated protein